MGRTPTPPAEEKAPIHIGDLPAQICERSEYWGRSTQEVVDIYTGKLKKVRLQTVALLLGDVALAIWSLNVGHGVLYLICLAGMIAIATWRKMRCEVCFQGLDAIVSRDCNPAGYRDVLEVLTERDKRGRARNTLEVELAYCDFLELDGAGALRRLQSVSFKRADNPRWFRALQIEFQSRIDVDDRAGAQDAYDRLAMFAKKFKGDANRAVAESVLADGKVLLRTPAERDAADALYMRSRMTTASVHQSRANWQLYLAEYEMLHGSRDEARRLASDASLDPLTPRMQHLRDDMRKSLDAC